ncbi:retention module-containing protein [Aeromonas sp. sia0103]|uniref:retention module-containing protein n=1 Tax=Aeromonas sp. sia0103 TaxID=2854782 RepID=UPI001C448F8C|nr:retention module-containing protein [Aeromonas sp. sia0103]MBV7598106.1 retention module-containing protein [Aeromonas sp. sia0103]
MAELRIEKPTLITQLEGTVLVMDADGSTRRATLGMQLQPGERLLAESDGRFELADPAGETHEPAQPDPVPGAQTAAVDPELASLQEAIRQGADPTAVFEETAAGNAAAATGGGVVGSSAGGFVVVDRANDATLAEAGFDTDHQRLPQGNDDPYVEDQDQVAEITITEPQTLDNIINADEATGVIIRGTVEDVEVGQTVTVTLIDQDGNRLTTTTVVLPGFVWEADFGDVTGKLVDGPLSIQADTQDAAGNRASDLGQTLLDTITTITLDLSDESDTGASQVDDLTRDTTPLLQGKGEPGATVTLSLGGKVLTVLTVDGNGNWQYQIPSDMADGAYDFRVDSVDIAGNRASDILTVTVDTRAGIDIDDLDTQNILGHDNVTLSGSTTQVEAGQSVTITLIGQNGQTLYSGAALVGSDGRWQLNGLDLSSLSGPYEVRAEVTDLAGNRVIDGAPLIGQSDTLTLSEADLADGPVSATGSLHTGAGMDGNLQVGFAADQGALQDLGLTSQGSALSYQLSGQTLTATAGGATVFTLTLANDGSYRIVWNQSLDHGQDSLSLPFSLEYRDSDGDLVNANLDIKLVDSTPPDFTLAPITLTEDAFTDQGAVVGQSQFVVSHQADPLLADSVAFADQAGTLARLNGSDLRSDGHALSFEFSGDRLLTGYYLDANGNRVDVLKAELSASQSGSDIEGKVTVSLTGPLDHQGSDQLSLGLSVCAKEIDGDETRADLVVTIDDGIDPSLGLDAGISLQEGGASQSLDGQLPVHVGSDRLVSLNFEASQPGLDDLTSGGKPTTYQVNGNQITLLDAGGKTILTVTLDLDGKYHLTLDGVLDQPVNTDSVNLGLQVQGTDFDGDQSNLGTLNIAITDGALPSVDAVSLNLVEDGDWSAGQTLTGSLNITAGTDPLANISFDASQPGLQGLTSGGAPVLISVSGNSISGSVNGQNVFTLTLDQQGHYVFTLNQPLDQGSADSRLLAGFTLTDSDGDKVSSSLSVSVGDGANPVISAVTGTSLTEANQGDGAVVGNMSFTVSHGSDALAPDSLKFDLGAIQQSLDGKFSSHGSPITFSLHADGSLVGTSADGREVLRAELDLADNNGNWSVTAKVTLSGELDHQGNESLDLPLSVTLTDKDGDSASTTLPLVIKDGNAPGFVAGSGVSLDEGNLDGSNTLTGTGHFSVNAGSDRVSEVSFAEVAQQPALTALGQQVKYELVDGDPSIPGNQILKGYVEVNGQRIEVLQVEISGDLKGAASNDFDYKVTLFEGVHQANGSSTTELPFKLNIVDSDKGAGNNDSTTGTLNVSIGEGNKPVISLTGVTLNEGRFDGAASGATGDDQQATGTLTITADSDPVVDVRLTLSGQVVDASGQPITHNGETLTWQEVPGSNGHSFQGLTASGTLVLTVTLPSVPGRIEAHNSATLDYDVTVHTNLDHGASDNLNLTLPLQVTDSDGTLINGESTVVIKDAADPSLGIDAGISLQEGGASQSLDGQLPVHVGSDRLVSLNFEANQPGLDDLTSGGKPTTYQVNGNQITLLDAGGKTVLTVTLDLDGKYHVQLDGVLDQPVNTNSVNLGLQVQGTDFDGDQSNLGTLNIAITDGALPGVDAVSLNLVEDGDWSAGQTLTGSLNITAGTDPLANISFDASQPGLQGLTSGGQPVQISVSGNSISGSVNGQNVFTLSLDQQGHYVFTLNQPLDQGSADSRLLAGFTLTDSDGDKVSSSLSVSVGDGANPVISAVTGTSLTEANQGDGAVVGNMSFTVSHGSDALAPDSLRFDLGAIQQSLDGKFSSHGSPITFSLDADGSLVGTSADGREVLRAELDLVDNNGNWSVTAKVTLSGELDHQGNESLDLPLNVTLTDKDGDSASTTLPLVIKDGNAPGFVAGSGVSLDEGNLDGSNALTGTGHFSVNAGSDRVSEVSFADVAEQPALTALGQQVKYELVDGDASISGNQILKGYVEVNGQRVEVLEVEISGDLKGAASNDFDYKVTLFEGVHQANGSSTELPFKLNIVDSDKGAGNNDSTTGTLNVSIGEGDKPVISLTGVNLSEGRFDGAASGATGDDQQATGKLTITADSDPVVDVRLTLSGQVVDASGQPITHNGEPLTWQEVPGSNGHSFQGLTASGTLVLTVTLPSVPGRIEAHSSATLDYDITVHTNLDHGASDNLELSLPLQVTDSDGTLITGDTTVVITDAADPLISAIDSVRVEEADLDAIGSQHPGTTPAENGEAAGGKVTIGAGSDRVATLELDVAAFNQANHLTSGGKEVTLAAHSPGWYLASAEGGKPVFWVHLDVNGSYSFHLVGQLDHDAQGKDELGIELPLFVTDFDGDRSPNVTVEVTVQDDMPIGTELAHNLSEAGSVVSGDLLPPANEGADGARVASVTVNGQVHDINGSLTLEVMSPDGKQVMGSLTIGQDGNYSFTPRPGFDHDDASLSQRITAQIVDGDGDTAKSTLTLNLQDEAVRFTVDGATGQEDQGAQDPSQGIAIHMSLDIGDFDRGEHVDQLLIQAPANAHGTFYYNGVALTTTADGKWFIVPPEAMVTTDKVNYSTSGLSFVPADDWSSWSNNKQPLHFQVQVQVGVTEGTPPPAVNGDLAITVQGIADKPVWVSGSTDQHYSINEDGNGIALNVKAELTDTDGSETLGYQIHWESGHGSLTLNGQVLQPGSNGLYTVKAGDINKITVVPDKDYSGDIKLTVTPVSTEKTPVVSGQDKAIGDPIELMINVNPQADDAKLSIRDIQGKEDSQLDLGSKISLAHLGDLSDGSEKLFVRIEGLPAGATLLLGGVVVVQDAKGYYEVAYDRIGELKLQPPKNSNIDFDLTIKGVVKDSATLTDANGQTHIVVNEKETGSQSLHVDLIGVVDQPHFDLGTTGWTAEGNGYTTTIQEDGRAPLDFRLESGEKTDTPLDNSESLNLVLEGLPEGAKVFDASGKELTLTFAGLDAQGKPTYQVDVSDLGNLQIQPPANSTADIHLIAHVVVTENDGDSKGFDVPLTIKVEPEIDAGNYDKSSHGLEDQFVVLDWHPDLTDGAEQVTHLSLSGIEPGYEIWVTDAKGTHQLNLNGGAVDLSDVDLQSLLNGGKLLVKAPQDSDKDTNIQSHVTVTQHDVDSSVVVDKVIDGQLHVDIQAVVEPDGNLVQTGGTLESPDGHDIPLGGVFEFQDLDPSSVETIDYLVISDLPPGFVVVGGISDGKGNWTVPNGALGSYALHAPNGFTGKVEFKVSALVHDLSDDGDVSASVRKDLNASADFGPVTTPDQKAADIDFDNSAPITGVEDHGVNFGSQLKSMVTLGSVDGGDDELSIVITGLPQGVSVQGLTFDFANGEYLIKLPGGLDDLDKLTLSLPEDYAGNDLDFNVRLVNTDTVSGDTKVVEKEVSLSITPEVDINGGTDGLPELQLQIKDVNGDGQPDNLEDTQIHLDLSVKLADISPSVADGGLETVESVTVTVDAKYGHFLDGNGQPTNSLVVKDPAALKDLVFVPREHFSGQVPLDIKVDILDTATTGEDRGSWSGQVGFEVKPVNDPANISVHDVNGNEDGRVSLAGFGASLIDNDGSEQIVALQIKGVPDGFTLSAPAVNNGGGVWQVPVGTDFAKLSLIPPANFSGSLDLGLSVFTLDKGLTVPLETSGDFTVTVNPVGDAIIADMQDKASGTEGDVITLNLGLETRDTQATGGSAGNVHENGPEQVRVTLEGVPDGAEIRLPSGVDGSVVDLGGGRWQITTDGGKLDAIELVTKDANGVLDLKVTAQSLDNGALGPEVNGNIQVEVSAVNDAPINLLPSDPQVAQEDKPFTIQGLQVKDVDAGSGNIEVRLSVNHGTLTVLNAAGVAVSGDGSGSLVLNGTLAQINALLNGGIDYKGSANFHGDDALTMTTNDLGNTGSGGALSDSDVLPIEVQPVNDAPVNLLPTEPQIAQEDTPFRIQGLQVNDVDAGGSPIKVTLSVMHGILELPAGSGVTVTGSGSDTLVLSGSQAEINALLAGGVTYQGEQDFNGQDALTMVTDDLGNTGSGGALGDSDVLPIEVQPVNDAPLNQAPAAMSVKEDGSLSLSGISVKDVDAGSAPLSMVLRVEHGVLTLLGAAGAVSVQGAGTGEITLVGSLTDLNSLINGSLHYEPAKDFWGQDNLTITTSDQGNSGSGGALTDSTQVGIQVTAEADDPQLSLGTHDIHALQGAWVPLNLSASVVNPATGELSVRIQNLGGAQVVDEHGQSVGHADSNGDWLLPMDQSVPIYLKDLPMGDHALTLSAESSAGGSTLSSTPDTVTVHSQSGHDLLGSDQNDWLFGSSGDDRILGGLRDDVLRGGHGNDILTGGAGSDLFVWGSGDEGTTGHTAIDTITDFHPEEGDKIDLADLLQGVTDNSVDGLLNHLSASVATGSGGLSDVSLSVSPAGDGQVTQQITLKDVDLNSWNLSGSSSHDILQSMLDNHSLIIQHP